MPGLPGELYQRCRETLLKCGEFNTDATLRVVFITAELAPFRSGLPDAASEAARVDACLAYLADKRLSDGRPVLPVFLAVLRDRYQEGDALRDELERLAEEAQSVLISSDRHLDLGALSPTSSVKPTPVQDVNVAIEGGIIITRSQQVAVNPVRKPDRPAPDEATD